MKCNKCGAELEAGAGFCGSCGARVESPEAPVQEAAAPLPVQDVSDAPAEMIPAEEAARPSGEIPVQTQEPVPVQVPAPAQNTGAAFESAVLSDNNDEGKPVSLVTWICRSLITLIPCVGWLIYIIMLFVWAFDKKYNSTSRNWAKAQLIMSAISIVLMIIMIVSMAGILSLDYLGGGLHNEFSTPNQYYYRYYN